jgi:predicted helicase
MLDGKYLKLKNIYAFPQLITYLRDEMSWPISRDSFETLDELFFEFTPDELGIDIKNAAKIQEIKRLRPLSTKQPWGIYFIKFEPKKLPVVALRRILSQVVLKKRPSANRSDRAAWVADDLLFVSNYGENTGRKIIFAHFSKGKDKNDLPTLKVLGWDNLDTVLHLDAVARELTGHLSWPADENNAEAWREQWGSAFTLRHREIITTSKELSIRLAELARSIRDRIKSALAIETKKGPLTQLMKSFHTTLVHDLSNDSFADMYAQTIAYGLLSAQISDPQKKTANDFAAHMRTNPFLRELMEAFLKVGGRKGNVGGPGIDFDELGVSEVVELLDYANMEAVVRDFGDLRPDEDPVTHFYELFLNEFDQKEKKRRGVFYTPRSVVSYIVRSVDELLRTEFGLTDGLADTTTWSEMVKRNKDLKIPVGVSPDQDFVQILDPATGTGTFLVEVIDIIHRTLVAKWKVQGNSESKIDKLWNEYVPRHLLTRLYGYELLMAPYAIAHLKFGLKLYETGYHFGSDERARVYLTNALEPAQDFSGQFKFAIPALAHEAKAVNIIKEKTRFTVIIGNPPYAGISVNMSDHAQKLVDRYRFIAGDRIDEVKLWLQNDYIKFIALAQGIVERSAVGVWGFITDNSYLDGPTFRGVRFGLAETFKNLRVLDLHGSAKRRNKTELGTVDENVFDITQGVSIVIGVATNTKTACPPCYADITGSRDEKYALLNKNEFMFHPVSWNPPFFLLVHSDYSLYDEYNKAFVITNAYIAKGNGFMTGRDSFIIGFTRSEIEARIKDFFNLHISDADIRNRYGINDYRAFKIAETRRELKYQPSRIVQVSYRPFDHRWTYFQRPIIQEWQSSVHAHMFGRKNRALCIGRAGNVLGGTWDICFCTKMVTDLNQFYRGGNVSLPIYWYPKNGELFEGRLPNFTRNFIVTLAETLGLRIEKSNLPEGVTSEDIFHYTYAVFHSPGYRSRYAEFLKIDFPRLPITGKLDLFRALASLGGKLVALHLLESPMLEYPITKYINDRAPEVEKVSWSNNAVWLDKAKTTGFKGVLEDVWKFHIGGYQVCEKWLKDRRGRRLSKDDIAHYQKIVVALSETIRLMKEIDEVIEQHGGWPGAFNRGE